VRLRFEDGTILLDDPPNGLDVGNLPGMRWDCAARRYRAAASSYRQLLGRLGELGVRVADDVRKYSRRRPSRWTALQPEDDELAAVAAWRRTGKRGTIVVPVGKARTPIAIAALSREGVRSLCLVPTLGMVEQWSRAIARRYEGEVGWYGGGIRRLAPVTVATFAGAERHMARLGSFFELLIVDEAHSVSSGLLSAALDMSIASARLGLTATPPRQVESVERLSERIGPVVFESSIEKDAHCDVFDPLLSVR
jgi:superfamily II DNA or RNA helicase